MSVTYTPKIDRRTTLKWVLSAAASSAAAACGKGGEPGAHKHTADLGTPKAVSGAGYGPDPNLVSPAVTWEKTMTGQQLRVASTLCDMIIPADEFSPAASAVGVPDFIDEWVSAPYPEQLEDRAKIFAGLAWIEQESLNRFAKGFADAAGAERSAILDDIAFAGRVRSGFKEQAAFFSKFRYLAMSAFYSTEEGMADIGYMGNRPMSGPYPGPTPEALEHLNRALASLGLKPV